MFVRYQQLLFKMIFTSFGSSGESQITGGCLMSFALKNNACGAAHVGLWITCVIWMTNSRQMMFVGMSGHAVN